MQRIKVFNSSVIYNDKDSDVFEKQVNDWLSSGEVKVKVIEKKIKIESWRELSEYSNLYSSVVQICIVIFYEVVSTD